MKITYPIEIGYPWELPESFTGLCYTERGNVWSAYLGGQCLGEYSQPSAAQERIEEAEEESNYEYLKSGLVERLKHASVIDGSESYDNWPDGLLSAVYRLIEQRDALRGAGEMYYYLTGGRSPACDQTMEEALRLADPNWQPTTTKNEE
jgi:hypothetical protein